MFTVTSKLAWGLTPLFLFSIVAGCAPEYRSASSKSKLDYWAPKDPWPNQKEGVCCFVYKDPPPEEATVVAQPNRDLENLKAALAAQQQENAALKQQLQAERAANSALRAEKADLAKQLDTANRTAEAEPALRLNQNSEIPKGVRQESQTALQDKSAQENQAELSRQLDAAKAELASSSAIQKKNDELAKKLEETRTALAQKAAREAEMEKSIKSMEQALKSESGEKAGSVRRGENSFTVEVADRILFNSGSARISPKGMKVIERIAGSLKEGSGKIIHVEGHTDDVPIRKSPPPRFLTNWELSAARAGNVVQYLENDGIKPDQLSAAGYSFTRPHVPNLDKASRALNRRVEIIVMPAPPAQAMLRRD
jgi:chemotaxis protein MotB